MKIQIIQSITKIESLLIENSKSYSYGIGNLRLCKLNLKEAITY